MSKEMIQGTMLYSQIGGSRLGEEMIKDRMVYKDKIRASKIEWFMRTRYEHKRSNGLPTRFEQNMRCK